MSYSLQAVLFIVSVVVSALVFVPLFLSVNKLAKNRRERFRQNSIENGCQVTAYYQRGSSLYVREEYGRRSKESSKYIYYGPDNKKYTKRISYTVNMPHEVTLYLDPSNPRKVYTDTELRRGRYIQFFMVLLYPTILIAGMWIFNLLSGFFAA